VKTRSLWLVLFC